MADSKPENFDSSLIASLSPSHPLYLHPWDDPGAVLVSEPFNGEGFDRWKRSILIALSARNKLGFIDGKMEKPSADSPLHDQWMRCNDMVISWILNALIKDIARTVIYTQTAKEIWTELEERFGEANNAKLYLIQKEISALSQGNLGIAAYYNKAKILWDELSNLDAIPVCTCQGCKCDARASLLKFRQNQKVIQFLVGLNDSYANVRRNILMMSPLPSMAQVYSLLIQEEKETKLRANVEFLTESASFDVTSQRQQPHKGKKEARKPTMFCDFCRRQGHTIEKCFKLHGYPGNSKNSKGREYARNMQAEQEPQKSDSESIVPGLSSDQSRQLITLLNNVQIARSINKIDNKDFFSAKDIEAAHFADSRASDHMVPTRTEKSSWELPLELVTEVLVRLPVMSLLRFRCVCKAWCSLISSPDFASLHLSRYHNDDDNLPFLTVMQIVDDYLESYWMLLSSDTYERRITGDDYAIVDRRLLSGTLYSFDPHGSSVNGLVLWSRESFGSLSGEKEKMLMLWNPMIRRAHELPTQYPPFSTCWWPPYFGLGFSRSRNDYKVVAIVKEAETSKTSVHVYSLSTCTWGTIVEYREDIIRQLHSDGQVLIEGAIHFVSSNSVEQRSHMVSFDVDDEVFTYIKLPAELELQDQHIYPVAYRENIGILNVDDFNQLCSLWVMENDQVAGSWSKVYTVDVRVPLFYRMLCFKKNGQFMLNCAEGTVMYDFESGEVKKIEGLPGPGQAMVYCTLYRGSLVLMQGLLW